MFKNTPQIDEEKYIKHQVFTNLEEMIDFYELLSFSAFGFLKNGVEMHNFDSFMYSSMQGTLESINIILKNGRINDSYSLLRKYYDFSIINIYANLYLKDNISPEYDIVEKINNWLQGTEQLPEFRIMSQRIRGSKRLEDINNILYKDNSYKEIRDHCNNL